MRPGGGAGVTQPESGRIWTAVCVRMFYEAGNHGVHLPLSCSPTLSPPETLCSPSRPPPPGVGGGMPRNLTSQPLVLGQVRLGIPLSRSRSGLPQGQERRKKLLAAWGGGSQPAQRVTVPYHMTAEKLRLREAQPIAPGHTLRCRVWI